MRFDILPPSFLTRDVRARAFKSGKKTVYLVVRTWFEMRCLSFPILTV